MVELLLCLSRPQICLREVRRISVQRRVVPSNRRTKRTTETSPVPESRFQP